MFASGPTCNNSLLVLYLWYGIRFMVQAPLWIWNGTSLTTFYLQMLSDTVSSTACLWGLLHSVIYKCRDWNNTSPGWDRSVLADLGEFIMREGYINIWTAAPSVQLPLSLGCRNTCNCKTRIWHWLRCASFYLLLACFLWAGLSMPSVSPARAIVGKQAAVVPVTLALLIVRGCSKLVT